MSDFPKYFIWGVSSASYQIEGAIAIDGRKASVWDEFCRRPYAVKNGDCADVGPDHYHHCRSSQRPFIAPYLNQSGEAVKGNGFRLQKPIPAMSRISF